MAYEIHALLVDPGEANAGSLERIREHEDLDEGAPLDPGKEARKRSIATALSLPGMGYEVIEHDYAKVADQKDVTEDQVRRELRHLQVDNGTVLIEIEAEHATLKVPVSGELDPGEVADMVFKTLRTLRKEGGMVPFDPQIGRELDLDRDQNAFTEAFMQSVEEARRAGAEEPVDDRPRVAWWQRLLGR